MYKKENFNKIVNLIKNEPLSQTEIKNYFNSKDISPQGIAKDLKRAERIGIVTYLGNKVSKVDAKLLLRKYFKRRTWPYNSQRCYVYVPKCEKFYRRIKKFKSTGEDTQKILDLYKFIEVSTMIQKIYFEDLSVLRADFKSRGENLPDKELKKKMARTRVDVKNFYNARDKKNPLIKILRFTPLMYWCAFHNAMPLNHPNYDPEKDFIKKITNPLISKLSEIIHNE
jgi:hypothetical protein